VQVVYTSTEVQAQYYVNIIAVVRTFANHGWVQLVWCP
jgi:hypothetical protein